MHELIEQIITVEKESALEIEMVKLEAEDDINKMREFLEKNRIIQQRKIKDDNKKRLNTALKKITGQYTQKKDAIDHRLDELQKNDELCLKVKNSIIAILLES